MARLSILDFISLGSIKGHYATDWQVAKDPNFEHLVLDNKKDEKNLLSLKQELRDVNTGEIYDPYNGAYARVRVYYGDNVSPWFNLPCCYACGNENND